MQVTRVIGIYSEPKSQVFSYPSGETVHFITICFRCDIVSGELRADGDEILVSMFAEPQHLPEPWLPVYQRWLADALANILEVVVR